MGLTSASIRAAARRLGFDVCGIAPAAELPDLRHFLGWIARGYAGEMHYLARTAARRVDVALVLPSVRSVIALGTLYNVDRPYSTELPDPDVARIARYAWGDDYHEVIRARLDALVAWMREAHGESLEARAYVDTGPVQERAFAQRAGLGWIGKNTCLINPALGSWLFLSIVLCSLDLAVDEPAFDRCGTCTLCLEACPTGALVEPWVMDARRCIAYLTVESRSPVPRDLEPAVGSHVFGCDICQEVCPWNDRAPVSTDPAWQPRDAFDQPRVTTLAKLTTEQLGAALKGSAMRRAGPEGLQRNLDVALRNLSARGHV
jgi:epoxyqueuosine reductase